MLAGQNSLLKQADQIKMLPDALSMLGIGGSNHEDILLIQDYLNSPDLLTKLDKRARAESPLPKP